MNNNKFFYGSYDFADGIKLVSKGIGEISDDVINDAVNSAIDNFDINLQGGNLEYDLVVNGVNKGTINIPKDRFLRSVDYSKDSHELVFTFETDNGEVVKTINIDELVDTVPTNLTDFTNDAGFVTEEQLENYYTKDEVDSKIPTVPTRVGDLINDAGYITEHQSLDGYATEEWVEEQNYLTEIPSEYATKEEITEAVADKADKDEIPSLAGYATEKYVGTLISRLVWMEEKVSALSKVNIDTVDMSVIVSDTSLDNTETDYVLSGNLTNKLDVAGKSVTIENATVQGGSFIKSNCPTEMKDVSFEGNFPKSVSNTVVSVNNANEITLRGVTFDSTSYNGIEIGLAKNSDSYPKSVLIDNCCFNGPFDNNVINVFATEDNAVINISNSTFGTFSNVLRLSNVLNKRLTVNFTNCEFTGISATVNPYKGIVMCQDYTSTSVEEAEANNLFGDGKITVNLINYTVNGVKIESKPAEEVCGSKDDNQLLYVYRDKGRFVNYDANKYPTLNII